MAEDSIAEDQIAAFVDRILRMKGEEDAIKADIKEIYAEAHGNGFNKTRLGEIVTYLRKVEKDKDAVDEAEAIRDLYLAAYYRAKNKPHTHAYARAAKSAAVSTTPNTSVPPGFDPETGEEVTEPQPETAMQTVATQSRPSSLVESEAVAISTPITEQQSAPAARDLTSDLSPQGDSGQVATHTPEMAELKEQAETTHSDPQWSGAAARKDAEPLAPTYAEPGEVVMESCPPVGIVAHPYAACWPVNPVDVVGGVRQPIVKIGNLIVDGRGRYFAARAAMIEYPVVQYAGDDLLLDMIQWNLRSRTMSPQARGVVMGKLQKLAPERESEIEDLFQAVAAEDRQAAE